MSRSSHPGHFFQTSAALSESARKAQKAKNTSGNPIKLPSKLLSVIADLLSPNHVYVAEAAGKVRHVVLETRETARTFSGPTAPLTSLAVAPKTRTLLAGCWDKSIWAWSLDLDSSSQATAPRRFANGHTDFVKSLCVTSLGGRDILFSGGADANICAWDVENGNLLYTMKGHKRGVLSLAIDPESYIGAMARQTPRAVLWSAGSDREIRAWHVSASSGRPVDPRNVEGQDRATTEEPSPLLIHETSVDSLFFDASGDLWTASADRSAKCLSRAHGWSGDTTLNHPDYVRDVVVDEVGGYVVTACRDEHVRVWEKGSGKLVHVFEGHYEEVTGLVLVEGDGQKVVSVGIDGTVREWSLKAADLQKSIEEAEKERKGEGKEVDEKPKENLMTEDEERELAELMEDDE